MRRLVYISVIVGLTLAVIAPAFAAYPVRSRKADSPDPVVIRVIPRTSALVLRPSPASTVLAFGSPPYYYPYYGSPWTWYGGGSGYSPLHIYRDYPLGPPVLRGW
jgi:hypothetical protein